MSQVKLKSSVEIKQVKLKMKVPMFRYLSTFLKIF